MTAAAVMTMIAWGVGWLFMFKGWATVAAWVPGFLIVSAGLRFEGFHQAANLTYFAAVVMLISGAGWHLENPWIIWGGAFVWLAGAYFLRRDWPVGAMLLVSAALANPLAMMEAIEEEQASWLGNVAAVSFVMLAAYPHLTLRRQ